ncbi:MAG TPA: hypothetical protein VI844_02595 [Coxiellaceae bacterium]|nr:hypothetical protein [Coxiellaceae bacterium]
MTKITTEEESSKYPWFFRKSTLTPERDKMIREWLAKVPVTPFKL